MRSIINELWHGNIVPQEDTRIAEIQKISLLHLCARLEKTRNQRCSKAVLRAYRQTYILHHLKLIPYENNL